MMQGLAGWQSLTGEPGRAADEERALARRPLRRLRVGDRAARGPLARAPRRGRLRLRRVAVRDGAAGADVRRHVGGHEGLRAAAAARTRRTRRSCPSRTSRRGRLDRHRRGEAEVLGAAVRGDRAARLGDGPAFRDDGRRATSNRDELGAGPRGGFAVAHGRTNGSRSRRRPASPAPGEHGRGGTRRPADVARAPSSSTSIRRSGPCGRSRTALRSGPRREPAGARPVPRGAHGGRASSCAATRPSGCGAGGSRSLRQRGVRAQRFRRLRREPPDPKWPNGARLALNFVLNYEEGGENTPLEGDPASEAFLHEVVGAPPTVGRRNLNTESMFEYGSRAGFWRVHRIFASTGSR